MVDLSIACDDEQHRACASWRCECWCHEDVDDDFYDDLAYEGGW